MLERRCCAVAHALARRLGGPVSPCVSHRGAGVAWRDRGLALARVAAAFVAVSTAACDAGLYPANDPQSVIRAYARDLEDGRADAAYRLLSDEARRGISLEAFRRMMSDDPEGVREIGRSLDRPTAAPVVSAIVTSPSGQELNLALEDGHWRIDGSAIDLYAADTPRRAIEGFVRAVERKRFDIVMHYVPETHKEGLDAAKLRAAWEGPEKDEIAQVIAGLKQALPSATIEESGERATMAYGAGTLQLVREHGLWKIENFD
jgi:hypothetical protein